MWKNKMGPVVFLYDDCYFQNSWRFLHAKLVLWVFALQKYSRYKNFCEHYDFVSTVSYLKKKSLRDKRKELLLGCAMFNKGFLFISTSFVLISYAFTYCSFQKAAKWYWPQLLWMKKITEYLPYWRFRSRSCQTMLLAVCVKF